ncbi:MAG: EI24 domain-containing protein [Pseudomonadota bacterium]
MLKHFLRAARQLDDHAFRSVLLRGVFSALIALIFAAFAARWGMSTVDIPFIDAPAWLLDIGALSVFTAASWFLFPAIATAVMGLFLDDIIDAVEAKHYPSLPAKKRLGFAEAAWMSVKLALVILAVNLLALPFYIILLFTAIGPLVLFVGINSYLLGREYFEMVAARHIAPKDVSRFRRQNRVDVFLLGLGITGLFMIPVINLIAPLVGVGAAVHSFHHTMGDAIAWRARDGDHGSTLGGLKGRSSAP